MTDSHDTSATVTPIDSGSDGAWDPASADPASAMATWRALEQARTAAQEEFETNIAPFKASLDEKVGPIDEQLDAIEEWFLNHAATTGLGSFASDAGKVTVSVRETPKITDAESFFSWAAASNNVGLLQKRISVTQYREFVKSNPDEVPPGVTVEADQSAKFKAAT